MSTPCLSMRLRWSRGARAALLVGAALACTSCGQPTIHAVSGKVLYNGSPAAGAAVFFRRTGASPASAAAEPIIMGIVQADGSFEVTCGSLGQGAPAGEYYVLVEWKRAIPPKKGVGCCSRPQHGPDVLRGRYAAPDHPRLHATVEASATRLPPFVLTDAN